MKGAKEVRKMVLLASMALSLFSNVLHGCCLFVVLNNAWPFNDPHIGEVGLTRFKGHGLYSFLTCCHGNRKM